MPYVIFNKQNNQYIRHPYKWVNRLSAATKFKTEENAKKFLACPPRALTLPSPDDIEILSADNLTSTFNTNYTFIIHKSPLPYFMHNNSFKFLL